MRFFFFILAFTAVATASEYTTYIGDSYPRSVATITADAAGNTYVVGNRAPAIIPTAGIVFSAVLGFPVDVISAAAPPNDVFVSKLDTSGNILFTAVFAGKGQDRGLAVAIDPTGNVYVAGTTTSPDFPVSNALQSQNSQFGAGFIVKLSPDGKTILYSTYFGGLAGSTAINAMTTDAAGNLYLTGMTFATDFPHTSGMPSAVATQNANIPWARPYPPRLSPRSPRRAIRYSSPAPSEAPIPSVPAALTTVRTSASPRRVSPSRSMQRGMFILAATPTPPTYPLPQAPSLHRV